MAYQSIPSSSTGITPDAVALARARTLLGSTIDFVAGSSFDNDQWYRADVSLSGTVTYSAVDRSGVLLMSTTGTANRVAAVYPHGATTVLIDNPRTSKWYLRSRIKFTSAVDSQASLTVNLLTAAIGAPAVRFGLRGSQSTGFYSASFTDNAGTDQFTATTTVAYDTTAYHLLEVWNDATTMSFAFDGAVVASSAVTNMGTSPLAPLCFVGNGTTATARTMSVDELYFCCAKQT